MIPDERLTGKQKNAIRLLGAACVLALITLVILILRLGHQPAQEPEAAAGQFVPPPFEENAVSGVPEVDEALGWAELDVRDGYVVHVCGNLSADNGGTEVWLASDSGNDVWLKLRMCDEEGNILGQTGILKPGEYVERMALDSVPEETIPVILNIMGYEPETYYSAGRVSLETVLNVG